MNDPRARHPDGSMEQDESVDKPGIIGARWWQESIAPPISRRTTMIAIAGSLVALSAGGIYAAASTRKNADDDVRFEPRTALGVQKEFGWSFGAATEALVFDGTVTQAFDRSALDRLAGEMAPATPAHVPYWVPTLFESVTATPTRTVPDETVTPLRQALVPISTTSTTLAYRQGQALAATLGLDRRARELAVIVDLPGPEAVAFAAGAASALDPVFLVDNWPHPRGVVPSHLTLASAAYYQPLFVKARAERPAGAPPMFVLDRGRLAAYSDEATQFDNRHVARMPTAENLRSLGTNRVLYVARNAVERAELDDLVDDFLAYQSASLTLDVVPATAFTPQPVAEDDPNAPLFYGGSPATSPRFWTDADRAPGAGGTNEVQRYLARPRVTPFSSGQVATGQGPRPRPESFGMVPVVVAVGTGVVLGARMNRNGSWNRASGWGSGGSYSSGS